MIDIEYSDIGYKLNTLIDDTKVNCTVVEKPFYDPKKR